METAASGRAIVATDVPGSRDVVRDAVNGLLVPPRDAVALAAAIEKLLAAPQARREMGGRGGEIAVADYSQQEVVRQMIKLYEDLLRPSDTQARTANAATEP